MKEKNKLLWLVGLLLVAGLTWYFGSRPRSNPANAPLLATEMTYKPLGVDNPELQREKLDNSRKTQYKSSGRDLFSEVAPPPVDLTPKPVDSGPVEPAVPAAPPPPSLPPTMKFFGYGTVPNGSSRRAFLADGDEVYIVGEGDTLLGKFRILKIGNANLDFEEIASGRRGSTTLDEQPATPAS